MRKGFLKLVLTMVRPPAALVLMLFAALGAAQAGVTESFHPVFTTVLVIIAAGFTNATCLNDITDESIDKVNLAQATGRPLVSGTASPNQLLAVAALAGAVSLGLAWAVGWQVGVVVTVGLLLNAAYSIPPVRLAERGGVATALLPLGYVVVPYLVAAFSVGPTLSRRGLLLLAGLYLCFAGRIILKDFRDVEGDAKFGKNTFLLRHGARATCLASAILWLAGAAVLPFLVPARSPVLPAFALLLGSVLYGLRRLASTIDRSEQITTIGCIAMVGRGMTVILLAHFSIVEKGWPYEAQVFFIMALAASIGGMFFATLSERTEVATAKSG